MTPVDGRFHVAVYRDGMMDLHLLGDEVFVSGGGGLAREDERGERMVNVEYGLSGQALPYWQFDEWEVLAFGGRWPDEAWLTTREGMSRSSTPPLVHRREGDFWKPRPTQEGLLHRAYTAVFTWHSGQVLGLRTYTPDPDLMDGDYDEISRKLSRRIDKAMARLRPGFDVLGPTPTPTTMEIAAGLEPVAAAAAPTGELFLLARQGSRVGKPRVQRWGLTGEAAVAGTVDVLPGMPTNASCGLLAVRAADEAYVACTGVHVDMYLARFDGATWTKQSAPEGGTIDQLSVAPDGELDMIVITDGVASLWTRAAGATTWQRVELPEARFADRGFPEWAFDGNSEEFALLPADPEAAARTWPLQPMRVLARAGGDLWVVARADLERPGLATFQPYRYVVLRTRPAREPLRMLPDGDLVLELLDWRTAEAWRPDGCGDDWNRRPMFVAMHATPRDAPRNAADPRVEAFVRENAAVMDQVDMVAEVFRRGRRTIGLIVSPKGQVGADALLAAVDRAAPGEKHTIECRLPRVRRTFDKTTGAPLQAPAL